MEQQSRLLVWLFTCLLKLAVALPPDGVALIAVKSFISSDPTGALSSCSPNDASPCHGVSCDYLPGFSYPRVVSLILVSVNLSGTLPPEIAHLDQLRRLDLSGNTLSGPIPRDFGHLTSLKNTLNLSYNHLSGSIPDSLGKLPYAVRMDFSYNNLSGEIPQEGSLSDQDASSFIGNPGLCGFPLHKSCRWLPSPPPGSQGAIIAIAISGAVWIVLVAVILGFFYYRIRICEEKSCCNKGSAIGSTGRGCRICRKSRPDRSSGSSALCEDLRETARQGLSYELDELWRAPSYVLGKSCCKKGSAIGSSGSSALSEDLRETARQGFGNSKREQGELVALDKAFSYELDELWRAPSYVLGKSWLGIVFKVILGSGMPFVVRSLGEAGFEHFKEFETEVLAIARVRHPNVVRLRAYYWADHIKLLIYNYIAYCSLAAALHGQAALPLTWAQRLKIAKGAAAGLVYVHDCSPKKHVPDFGLARLATIAGASTTGGSILKALSLAPSSSMPYRAPECDGRQKSDVYSFGVVLLEIMTRRSPAYQLLNYRHDLATWVGQAVKEEKPLSKVLDPLLLSEVGAFEKQIVETLHLAFLVHRHLRIIAL